MSFDQGGGQGGGQGGWPPSPGGGAWPPPQGQPGAPPQGGWGPPPGAYGSPPAQPSGFGPPPQGAWGPPTGQGDANAAPPPPGGWGPPPGAYGSPPAQPSGFGAAPPPGAYGSPPAQPSGFGAAPQGAWGAPPPQGAWGAPPPQGMYGSQPAQGYPVQQPAAGTGFSSVLERLSRNPPTNAWFPGAVVSLFFPGLGLLFLRKRAKLAFAIFGAAVAVQMVFWILGLIVSPKWVCQPVGFTCVWQVASGSPALYSLFSIVRYFLGLLLGVGSMIYTHDETVREHPNLGQPILFKNPLPIPAQLQD